MQEADPWSPLSWYGDSTLVPAHIIVGGSKTDVAKADRLLAVLAMVAWNSNGKERERGWVKVTSRKTSHPTVYFQTVCSGRHFLGVICEYTGPVLCVLRITRGLPQACLQGDNPFLLSLTTKECDLSQSLESTH